MFQNLRIGQRIGLSFSLLLLFLLIISYFGVYNLKIINSELKTIVEEENVRNQFTEDMVDHTRETSLAIKDYTIACFKLKSGESTENIQEHINILQEKRINYNEALQNYKAMLATDDLDSRQRLEKIDNLENIAMQNQDKVIDLGKSGQLDKCVEFELNVAAPSVVAWKESILEMIKYEDSRALLQYESTQTTYKNIRLLMIVLGLFALISSIFIIFSLNKLIVRPIVDITKSATQIANGTLDVELKTSTGENEIGLLTTAFIKMVKNLRQFLGEINEGVSLLATSSTQILAATTQVAAGTSETATAISETSTTVEEVQQASKQSAMIARSIADNSQHVLKIHQEGKKAVDETIAGMNDIHAQMGSIGQTIVRLNEQSQSIGGIIAAVTDIADQSNLLAVNAAIEAAKAGEQGKGFAVVAQEIKNLAGQSKQATLQVRNILNDIQKATTAAVLATEQGANAVTNGLKQSIVAGDAIRILSESTTEAVQSSAQIVASSQQQVIGMEQIGVAMQNINQAGSETAVSMAQSEKSARNLYELGQKLKTLSEKFTY